MTIVPVILAGGIGERFWPLSRSSMPKQMLRLVGNRTMAEETLSRVHSLCSCDSLPLIITSKAIAGKLKKAISQRLKYNLIVEPKGKNTAPAVALAAAWIEKKYGDSVMMVLSADHHIYPVKEFVRASRYAIELAQSVNSLVVFGIRPSRPETGYGYIQLGEQTGSSGAIQGFKVKKFVEKPSAKKACKYLESGKYMWNSGMFVWRTSVILQEFRTHMPEIYKAVQALSKKGFTKAALEKFYDECEKESIDYGILEKSSNVNAVVGQFGWDDIGSWESLCRLHGQDSKGTTVTGKKIFHKENRNSIIVNKSSLSVAAIGASDTVLVVTDDTVLLIDRSRIGDLKRYLAEMKKEGSLPLNLF
ncbi:MAG: NTP transferase domain-containing protein [Fibrobacter sp.]|jgi:mannose-1-phosphate guanylyltransferase|nr:NTP transferase domain-containing protein [Fibrobacter sp.]